MFERFLFKKELNEILKNNNLDPKKVRHLNKQDKLELFEKFEEIALKSGSCGVFVNEYDFLGYLNHSKFKDLLG